MHSPEVRHSSRTLLSVLSPRLWASRCNRARWNLSSVEGSSSAALEGQEEREGSMACDNARRQIKACAMKWVPPSCRLGTEDPSQPEANALCAGDQIRVNV